MLKYNAPSHICHRSLLLLPQASKGSRVHRHSGRSQAFALEVSDQPPVSSIASTAGNRKRCTGTTKANQLERALCNCGGSELETQTTEANQLGKPPEKIRQSPRKNAHSLSRCIRGVPQDGQGGSRPPENSQLFHRFSHMCHILGPVGCRRGAAAHRRN